VTTTPPALSELTCEDPSAPGRFVACSLRLEVEGEFNFALVTNSCAAHGNILRITAPVVDTLTTDGCYEAMGKQISVPGPFLAQTEINAEVIAPRLTNPPRLLVSGSYPEWTLTFEDGGDADFDDLVLRLTATPFPGSSQISAEYKPDLSTVLQAKNIRSTLSEGTRRCDPA
jgi:hypothetical protein